MKKQILILIVAFFAIGFSNAFGQGALNGSLPIPITCTNDLLHPIAGIPYNYATVVNPAGGNFQWWATKDQNFISTVAGPPVVTTNNIGTRLTVGGGLTAASASYGVTSPTDNTTITWSSATLAGTTPASPTFVAVQYDAPAACANNFKVYKIIPVFAFTVDIKNVEDATNVPLAYGAAESQCVGKTLSAVYDPAANAGAGEMVMDYGYDTLYYEVVAANFTGFWTPSFQLDGLLTGQAAVVGWSYANTYAVVHSYPSQNGTTGTPLTYTDVTPVNVDPSVVNTNIGVSIFVRVIVHNQHNENLAGQSFTLHVEGTNAEGTHDVVNTTCAPPVPATGYEDLAAQMVNPRPTVSPVAPGVFVPQTTP